MAKSPGSDVVSHFAYDARWRIVARYEDANSDPTEQFVFHHAGLASTGSGSYIDAVLLHDRDTHLHWGANGTLDERVYHLHNWRSDVVALISHAGSQIEQVRYEPYGTPFCLPAGDTDSDGDFDANDVAAMTGSYDVRKDVNMDGTIDYDDVYAAVNIAASYQYLGRGVLSSPAIGSRKGYASYEHLAELEGSGSKWDVRNRVLLSQTGQWNRRDPMGYVDSMNLFQYTNSSPIQFSDPFGLCRVCFRCHLIDEVSDGPFHKSCRYYCEETTGPPYTPGLPPNLWRQDTAHGTLPCHEIENIRQLVMTKTVRRLACNACKPQLNECVHLWNTTGEAPWRDCDEDQLPECLEACDAIAEAQELLCELIPVPLAKQLCKATAAVMKELCKQYCHAQCGNTVRQFATVTQAPVNQIDPCPIGKY